MSTVARACNGGVGAFAPTTVQGQSQGVRGTKNLEADDILFFHACIFLTKMSLKCEHFGTLQAPGATVKLRINSSPSSSSIVHLILMFEDRISHV